MCQQTRFSQQLEELCQCDSGLVIPHVYLPRDDYQRAAWLPEESFSSKSACVQYAQARLQAFYREAEEKMAAYTSSHSSHSFLARFRENCSRRLDRLLEIMEQDGLPGGCSPARILPLLTTDGLFSAMEEVNARLQVRFTLPSIEHYAGLIAYDVSHPGACEEGIARLLAMAFTRHGCDLLPVVQALECDAVSLLQQYQDAFHTQAALEIRRQITDPLRCRLVEMRQPPSSRQKSNPIPI